MEKFFEKKEYISKPSYPQYFLQHNPFYVSQALLEKQDAGDTRSLFLRHVYQKEINRIMAFIGDLASQPGMPRLWILKDDSASPEHSIAVIGGIFRTLLRSESPRFYATYAPLPMLAENPLREVTHLLVDRFQDPIFRRCLYSFIYQELEKVLESNQANEVLPEVDVEDILARMNETRGEVIEEILFPKKEEEEESGVESQESEVESQESGEEEESEVESQESEDTGLKVKETEEEKKQKEIARRLADFIVEVSKKMQFGAQVESAIEVTVRESFSKGLSNLSQYLKYRELIPGLIQLLFYVYKRVVVLVDQLEMWGMFEEAQKGRFIGTLSELEWLAKDKAILIFSSYAETLEEVGETYTAGFIKQTLDLKLANIDVATPLSDEQLTEVLSEFMASDPYRTQKKDNLKRKKLDDLYPFTEDGVKQIIEHEYSDIVNVLDLSGRLLDEGRQAGYPIIDREFVRQMFT